MDRSRPLACSARLGGAREYLASCVDLIRFSKDSSRVFLLILVLSSISNQLSADAGLSRRLVDNIITVKMSDQTIVPKALQHPLRRRCTNYETQQKPALERSRRETDNTFYPYL